MSEGRKFLWNITGGFLTLALCIGAALGQASSDDTRPAALVNGEAIARDEVQKMLDARPNTVPLPLAQQHELRKAALNLLIDDVLIRQFLHKNVPGPSSSAVDKEWDKLKETMVKEQKTMDDFLREARQTEAQVKADIAARIQWNAYLHSHITDVELRSYYQANKPFFDKTFVQASHILVKADSAAARAKAQQKLEYIRHEIITGKITFEEAARRYSDCPSKEKGGDVGQFPYKFIVVEPFARAAFALKKNEISGIVATDSGLHLIKVTDRKEGPPSNFEDVKETVREVYAKDQGIYNRVLTEQRKSAVITIYAD